ncbi:MAG: hypothetical protein QNJ54_09640 [Prochloraceae cyanobacterium]|nr:hypothetical protein [Prochloraceae cyanobacterium]
MTSSKNFKKNLTYSDVYNCPVCRHGEISAIPLMEAFACNFCRHIFTANLEKQLLKMADSQIPLTWRWDGQNWRGMQRQGFEVGWFYWIAGMAFVMIPPTIVGVGAYLFPPLPSDPLFWFPFVWTPLTFLCHLACLLWLVVEYYQFPVLMYLGAITQRLWIR